MDGLRLLGFTLPDAPTQADVGAAIALEHQTRADRPITSFLDLPDMRDQTQSAVMQLLLTLLPCAFVTGQSDLWGLMVLNMVNFSYQYGNTPASAVAYGSYGILLGAGVGDYQAANAFGELAAALVAPLKNPAFDSKIFFIRGTFLSHWRAHMRQCIPLLVRARQESLDSGDFFYASYSQESLLNTVILQGDSLAAVETEVARSLELSRRLNTLDVEANAIAACQWVKGLRGQTADLADFSDAEFDEQTHVRHMQNQRYFIPLIWYSIYKLQALYLAEQYQAMDAFFAETEPLTVVLFGTIAIPERNFYHALALASLYPIAGSDDQLRYRQKLEQYQTQFKVWADNCAENFSHKYALINAEMARVAGHDLAAMDLYDQAITSAQNNDFIHHEAMANEIAARFFLSRNKAKIARVYLAEAHYAYHRLGAIGKVRQLAERYRHLLPRAAAPANPDPFATLAPATVTTTTTGESSTTPLDLNTIMKAAQSIVGEIVLSKLLERLLQIAIENAGAQRGLLIINENGQLMIEAEGAVDQTSVAVLQTRPVAESQALSAAVVNYVARTGESLVLDDPANQGQFTRDGYISARQPRSILCAPLIKQGRLNAILYLENNLTSGAFTPDRLATLNLLTGQAAIAIENARLYTNLEASEKKYRALFEESRDAIFISAPNGQVLDINPAGLSLFGYTREAMVQLDIQTLYADPADRLRLRRQIERDGMVRDFEVRGRRLDGTELDCLMTATQRRDKEGTLLGFQGIIRDITAQKRAEQERLRLSAIERELTLAHSIQQSLLPPPRPEWNDIDLVCYTMLAREVGGDLYAYHAFELPVEDGTMRRYAVAIGDVSGKGMPAALLMAVSLASFRSAVAQGLPPGALLARLDQALMDYTRTTRQNCALACLEIEVGSMITLRVANAGCITPLLKRATGAIEWIDVGGIPLGIGLGCELGYQEATMTLAPGDIILLTSDGIVEANNGSGELFGFERLEQVVATGPHTSAEGLLHHVRTALNTFTGTTEQHDDLTLIAIQV